MNTKSYPIKSQLFFHWPRPSLKKAQATATAGAFTRVRSRLDEVRISIYGIFDMCIHMVYKKLSIPIWDFQFNLFFFMVQSWKYGCVWKWLVPLNPMVLLIIIPFLNCYFIGNIPYFQTNPYGRYIRNYGISDIILHRYGDMDIHIIVIYT